MRNLTLAMAVALAVASVGVAEAQIVVTPPTVQIAPPQIVFPSEPVLVEASPGVRVVPDYDEEVFVVNNIYWVRRDGHWFRSAGWNGRWVYVEPRHVPQVIVRVPPGHYKHWKGHGPHGHGHGPHGPYAPGPRGRVVVAPGPGGPAVVNVKIKGGHGHGHGHGGGKVKVKIR